MNGPARLTIDDENPWPGLAAFDENAERFFNGRSHETAELRRLVLQAPVTALFGASGLGKTSLIQAGLFPLLRAEGMLPVYVRLDVRDRGARLIDQVTHALNRELELHRVDCPPFGDGESLWHYLHRDGLELWSAQNKLLAPLIVLDQFEEVFTLGAENTDNIAGLRADLADLIENRLPPSIAGPAADRAAADVELALDQQGYRVLLSFREDFLPALEGWKRDLPSIMRNRFRLLPMSGERAFEAVHKTAPHLTDEKLAHAIVRFVAAAQEGETARSSPEGMSELAVEPALLSLVCHGLNERRKRQGKAAFDAALLSQSGRSIISDYYEQSVRDLPEDTRRFIETELITERGYRKPSDIDDARSKYGVSERDLRLLVDRRLLRLEPHRGADRVELTHDLLTGVVREHRERQRTAERSRRQRRLMTIALASGAVLVALVLTFLTLYWNAERQKRDAERQTHIATIQRLAAQADGALARFPQRSLALAVESINDSLRRQAPVVAAAEQSLWQALAATGGLGFGGAGTAITSVATSPDGHWLGMIGPSGVYLSDLTAPAPHPERLIRLPAATTEEIEYYPPRIAFSSDGRLLVATGLKAAPRLWSLSDGPPAPITTAWPAGVARPLATAVSANGTAMASIAEDLTTVLWDLTDPNGIANPVALKHGSVEMRDVLGRPFPTKLSEEEDVWMDGVTGSLGIARFHGAAVPQHRVFISYLAVPVASPDGRWVVGPEGEDGKMLLRDLKAPVSSTATRPLPDDVKLLPKIAFSSNSGRLVIGGEDGTIWAWDLTADARSEPTIVHRPRPAQGTETAGIAISADGVWLLAAGLVNHLDPNRRSPTSAWLWDLRLPDPAAKPLELSGHESGVGAVAITPDARWAVTGSDGGVTRLWNLTTENPSAAPLVLRGHEGGIHEIATVSGSRWVVTRAVDGSARVWDLRAPQPVEVPLELRPRINEPTVLATSSDGRWMVTGGRFDPGHLWDLHAPNPAAAPIALQSKSGGEETTAMASFSPDARWLVAGSEYGPALLFDLRAGKIQESVRSLDKGEGEIHALMFSGDSRWLVMNRKFTTADARVWDLKHPQPGFAPFLVHGKEQGIRCLALSGDGRWMSSSSADAVQLWDLNAQDWWRNPVLLESPKGGASNCQFIPDGKLLTAMSGNRLMIWDIARKALVTRGSLVNEDGTWVREIEISPDGTWIAASSEKTTRLWSLRSPQPASVGRELKNRFSRLQFTPDSRWLITSAEGEAHLWNLQAANPGTKPVLLRGFEKGTGDTVVSADGRWLAATSFRGIDAVSEPAVRLWDLTSTDPSAAPLLLLGHERGVSQLAMTGDSRWLVTAADDQTLRFWDLRSPDPSVGPLVMSVPSKITSLHASTDGRVVVTVSEDRVVRLWRVRMNELLTVAQRVSGRNLSSQEWKRFFPGQPYRPTFPSLPDPDGDAQRTLKR